jgi:hypothetical protein
MIRNERGLVTLTALLLGSLAAPASAQNRPMARVAPEKHFTIPAGVPTPVVLLTEPDAACDLHDAGVNDPSQTMRLYGNIEGYIRFHFTPKQDIQDAYLQLDCTTQAAVTTHPLHLRIAASPTADMPAPERAVPAPRGSKIRPALTAEAARQLSDEEIRAQGYPSRPNTTESAEDYAKWLNRVSRPVTILPPNSVSRTGVSHSLQGVAETTGDNSHWSGFVAQGPSGSFREVEGSWSVPLVWGPGPTPAPSYSSIWAGLDGLPSNDVVQAGTEQDVTVTKQGEVASFYAWTEVWPQQPTAHKVFSVSPGDLIVVDVFVGDSQGNVDPSGNYAWFTIQDQTSWETFTGSTKLNAGFGFSATSAEWIVERPLVGGTFPELSDYSSVLLTGAWVLPAKGTTLIPYSKAENLQLTMRGSNWAPWYDNNVLSTVAGDPYCPTCMNFYWKNFH